ncbi:MAG: hypothetical protein E7532_06900 [Ruminococcaceae bacterium]|nr:hypothetical protein [Oscillospiraceae bacterium]
MRDITINDILKMLLAHIKLIIIVSVVLALGAYIYADNFIQKSYSASTMICIKTSGIYYNTELDEDDRISSNSIGSSENLAENLSTMFQYATEISAVRPAGYSVSIAPVNETNFMRITVVGADSKVCADTANAVRNITPTVVDKYISDGEAILFGSPAVPSARHTSPDATRYALFGFIAGLIISILISIILEVIDTTIKSSDDLYKMYDIPVFAEIVDFDTEGGVKRK